MTNSLFKGEAQKKAPQITHLCLLGAAARAKTGNRGLSDQFDFECLFNNLISIRRESREMFPKPRMRREVLVVKRVVLRGMRGRMMRRKRRKM